MRICSPKCTRICKNVCKRSLDRLLLPASSIYCYWFHVCKMVCNIASRTPAPSQVFVKSFAKYPGGRWRMFVKTFVIWFAEEVGEVRVVNCRYRFSPCSNSFVCKVICKTSGDASHGWSPTNVCKIICNSHSRLEPACFMEMLHIMRCIKLIADADLHSKTHSL